ncbi:hypothetical protein EGH25_04955 [Haladaptatus sp. F3-133]|jgi:hypothetical protein|uniref:Uncharacterized protein n=1 Tax=Halorutilus salinus TaxID=2487751 RepID=A0A9Q4C4A8_9EURY|nr:hypothetical protein [Halorutilus salinus]MCX2818699.1 hypothetical protein [Halorutilus salinus]
MGDDTTHTYLLLGIGGVLSFVAVGQKPGGTQLVTASTAFVAFLVGLVKMYVDGRYETDGDAGGLSGYLRPVGASLVFLSTFLPYLPLPFDRGVTREPYSFAEVVVALASGAGVEGSLSIVIFAAVVFAGAAASLLHYTGGYVVLFGVAGYGYVVSLVMEMSVLTVLLTEFRSGTYVATAGALLVILSSLIRKPPKAETDTDRRFVHQTELYSRRKPDR